MLESYGGDHIPCIFADREYSIWLSIVYLAGSLTQKNLENEKQTTDNWLTVKRRRPSPQQDIQPLQNQKKVHPSQWPTQEPEHQN